MGKRSMFLLVAVFGLLPFWISLAVLLAGVLKYGHSGEYAAAAGWYTLLGALYSGYTLVVAILTLLVHGVARGDAARKRRFACAPQILDPGRTDPIAGPSPSCGTIVT